MIVVYLKHYDLEEKYSEHDIGLRLLLIGLWELYKINLNHNELLATLDYNEYGKPFFRNNKDIHFNISHCCGIVACAFSSCEIGIDIERIEEVNMLLIEKVLTDKEKHYLNQYNNKEIYKELFYRYWTLKESYLKWCGKGFYRDPKNISFDINYDNESFIISCSDKRVKCYQKKVDDHYILSICSRNNEEIDMRYINL